MKKTLLLTLALLLSTALFAQRGVLMNETFDSASLPEGWTTPEGAEENWIISQTNYAGGTANELQLSWWPMIMESSQIMTSAIDLSGINEVVLSFNHYLDNQINEYTLSVATSSDGVNWNTAWSQVYGETGLYEVEQIISTPDMGKENVMFALIYEGTSYTMNGWYFDNFQISTQENLDLSIVSIDIPEMICIGTHKIPFTIQNLGATTIETFEASFIDFSNNDNVITETFEANLESLESQQFTFSQSIFLPTGEFIMPIEIVSVNGTSDINSDNNSMEKNLNVGMGVTQKIPMIESFSSSTCSYCVEGNILMNEVLEANPGKYTYTKYPVNFPGTGDPYYFNEVAGRAGYYQVSQAPEFYLDGTLQEFDIVTQEALDESYNTPSFVNVRGAFNVEGNTINITADFMSYIKMENVRAFVSVNEKVTTENATTNGETEFHHIMMKMLDSPTGNVMSINAGEYQRLEFSHDMSSTNVEEMDDLEVSLWLQNYETGEIYNSHFAYEYTDHPYPVRDLDAAVGGCTMLFGMIWTAPEYGTPTGYDIYLNGQLIEENCQRLFYSNNELGQSMNLNDKQYIAEVVAVHEDGKTSVAATKIVRSGEIDAIVETENHSINIYPNPAKDFVRVSTVNGLQSTVRVYNSLGMLVDEIEMNSNEVEVNVSDYKAGVYFISVQTKSGNVVKKMIVK